MNVSLPDELKRFVDGRVDDGGFGSTSEYVRALIRLDQDRQGLRGMLFEGARSAPGPIADTTYFAELRNRIRSGT